MRKEYVKPAVRAENLTIGVFGCYGGDSDGNNGGGSQWSPIGWFNPLFQICCGGGGN